MDPFLCNDLVNIFPQHRIRRQQLDNFHCYATRCKYNSGSGVFYVVRIFPLLGNRSVFYGSALRLYKCHRTESELRERQNKNENGVSPQQSRKKGLAEE
jgi:hypothetical protein